MSYAKSHPKTPSGRLAQKYAARTMIEIREREGKRIPPYLRQLAAGVPWEEVFGVK